MNEQFKILWGFVMSFFSEMSISNEQHLVLYICNAASNTVSGTQRKEIINMAKNHFICNYKDTLFMNMLYCWQYNILFILKYEQKVHVKINKSNYCDIQCVSQSASVMEFSADFIHSVTTQYTPYRDGIQFGSRKNRCSYMNK